MYLKKAVLICDDIIASHLKLANGMREKVKDWSDHPKDLAMAIAETSETVALTVSLIKENIQTNCKHPEKMIDVCEGQKYCMKCNSDIDD